MSKPVISLEGRKQKIVLRGKDIETDGLIRQLAALTGESITERD
jgi:hypothetical protein